MATYNSGLSGHSPNPLRPYYVPSTAPFEAPVPAAPAPPPPLPPPTISPSTSSFISELQEYSYDIPSASENFQHFLEQSVQQYGTNLFSQPFLVAKTILQCQHVPRKPAKSKVQAWKEENEYGEGFDDLSDSDEEPNYFASTTAADNASDSSSPPTSPRLRSTRKPTDRTGYIQPDPLDRDVSRPLYQLRPIPPGSVNEALKALWTKEGAWGIWKGQNATFIYNILSSTIETWSASLLSTLLSLPDPTLTEIADSTHPLLSLGCCVAASAFTALLLAPLDIIRTKLLLTPSTSKPRNLLPALRTLDSLFVPSSLVLPTALYAVCPAIIHFGTPYLLRTRLFLDPIVNQPAWTFFEFLGLSAQLLVKLPLETILRRGQIAAAKPQETIVPVGRYAGVLGTAWVLLREEEGGRYGIEGLYRGWRMGIWGNVARLGSGFVGSPHLGDEGEF